MEVILLEKTANLGNLGDKVTIKAGYGRNYLIPQGKAVPATPAKIKEFEERRAELEKQAAEKLAAANARAEALSKLLLRLPTKPAMKAVCSVRSVLRPLPMRLPRPASTSKNTKCAYRTA